MSFQLFGEFWSMDTSNIRIKVQVVLALGEIVLFKIIAENQQKQGFYIFSGTADIVSTYIPIYQAQTNIASWYTKLRPKALPDIEIILHFSDIEKTSRQRHETVTATNKKAQLKKQLMWPSTHPSFINGCRTSPHLPSSAQYPRRYLFSECFWQGKP